MSPELIAALSAAVTGLLAVFGGGIRWMLSRADTQNKQMMEWQSVERQKLEAQFTGRIEALEIHVKNQDGQIIALEKKIRYYSRHVGYLEGMLRANGLTVPPMEDISK